MGKALEDVSSVVMPTIFVDSSLVSPSELATSFVVVGAEVAHVGGKVLQTIVVLVILLICTIFCH